MKTTIDLKKSLSKYNESIYSLQEDLLLDEVQKIIVNNEEEDLLALMSAGLSANLHTSAEIITKRKNEFRFKQVYDIKAIKKLAVNYGLRFLPATLYKGTIDPLLPSIIKNFIKDNNLIIKEDDEKTKLNNKLYSRPNFTEFYILAPKKNFNLQRRPKDPLLFYKINEDKYALVHKWGNDISILRAIRFFLVRDWYYLQVMILATAIVIYRNITEVIINSSNGLTNKALVIMLTFVFMVIGGSIYSNLSPKNNWKNEYKD